MSKFSLLIVLAATLVLGACKDEAVTPDLRGSVWNFSLKWSSGPLSDANVEVILRANGTVETFEPGTWSQDGSSVSIVLDNGINMTGSLSGNDLSGTMTYSSGAISGAGTWTATRF